MLRGFPVALTGENDGHDDDDGDFDICPRRGVPQRYRHHRQQRHKFKLHIDIVLPNQYN